MSLDVTHYPEEDRLDITIEGNLDLTLTSQILDVCKLVDTGVVICVIDATRVRRVFDSGLAVLMLLMNRLAQFQARLVIVGNIGGLMLDPLPESLQSISCLLGEELPASETLLASVGADGKRCHSSCIQQYQSSVRHSTTTITSQHPDVYRNKDHKDGSLPAAKVGAPLEEIEHRTNQEYLPMDVFVSPLMMREHFQHFCLRAERSRIHGAAALGTP